MKLGLLKSSSYEITRERSTDDEWDRGDSATDWTFDGVRLLRDDQDYSVDENFLTKDDFVAGDTIYLVIAVWSTGDSFGHDEGACSEVFGAFKTNAEAEDFARVLASKEKITVEGSYYSLYRPWDGYFEHLNSIEVYPFVVQKARR